MLKFLYFAGRDPSLFPVCLVPRKFLKSNDILCRKKVLKKHYPNVSFFLFLHAFEICRWQDGEEAQDAP